MCSVLGPGEAEEAQSWSHSLGEPCGKNTSSGGAVEARASVSPNWGIWEGFPEVADDDCSKSRLYQGRGREWAGRCGREQGRQSRTWLVPLGGGRGLPGEAWGPGSPKGQAEGLVCQDLRGRGRAS